MSFRDDFLPVFDWGRSLVQSFGLRTNSIVHRKRVWSGGHVGIGTATTTDTAITPTPKIREMDSGRLIVGPITPVYAGGGYSVGQFRLGAQFGQTDTESTFVITGPSAGEYIMYEIDVSRPFGYFMELENLSRNKPSP